MTVLCKSKAGARTCRRIRELEIQNQNVEGA